MGRTPPGETREKVLGFMRERLLAGRPPTVREVQERFGFRAVQTARKHLEALVDEGRLVVERGRSRGYRLPGTEGLGPVQLVPILGRVQAGELTEAIEDPDGYVTIERPAGKAGTWFALTVEGESMVDAGIFPGDLAIVRQQQRASDGDVVVAMVDGEATVKRLRLRRGRIELHPENEAFRPIIPDDPSSVRILGKVLEIRRRF